MSAYDAERFDPPAPLAQVTLRNSDNRVIQPDVPMLLDSGADVTLVPQTAVDSLGVAVVPDRQYAGGHLALLGVPYPLNFS